jgi:hypothetical protein
MEFRKVGGEGEGTKKTRSSSTAPRYRDVVGPARYSWEHMIVTERPIRIMVVADTEVITARL